MKREELVTINVDGLRKLASKVGVKNAKQFKKEELIAAILEKSNIKEEVKMEVKEVKMAKVLYLPVQSEMLLLEAPVVQNGPSNKVTNNTMIDALKVALVTNNNNKIIKMYQTYREIFNSSIKYLSKKSNKKIAEILNQIELQNVI